MPRSKAHEDLARMAAEMREEARFLNASAEAIETLLPTMTDEDAARIAAIKAKDDVDQGWPVAPPFDPCLN